MNAKEKKSPSWKQYEWLITKIFHDNRNSFSTEVIHDTRLEGEYSEISRQIDILVTDKMTGRKTISVYCNSCGVTTVICKDEACCPERDIFISKWGQAT